MKVLGISCSPRRKGNTETLVGEALEGSRSEGAEVELFSVAGKDIKPCDGCQTCVGTGRCHIKDDMQELYQKMIDADGIIFGMPIYFYTMNAQAKIVMDRSYAIRNPTFKLANKAGGIIAVATSIGLIEAIKDFYFYIAINHMLAADYVGAYASERGEVKDDQHYMKMAWELGREIVQLAKLGFQYPEEFRKRGLGAHVAERWCV